MHRFLYRLLIILFGDITLAGRVTLMDMIIQAGPFLSDIPGQVPIAAPEMIQLVEQLDRIPHRLAAGVGPEIPGFVLFPRYAQESRSRRRFRICLCDCT